MVVTPREAVVAELLRRIERVNVGRRAIVAIDGFDGAGKTHLARELTERASGHRQIVNIGLDGFHRSRSQRYANGRDAQSFYRDSYRYTEFRKRVVDRVRSGRSPVESVWDVGADTPTSRRELPMAADGILVVDGIFLHRPELRDCWDASIWLRVPFRISVPRGNSRFPTASDRDPNAASNQRYVGGQRLYVAESAPEHHATWIVDNSDLNRPLLVR